MDARGTQDFKDVLVKIVMAIETTAEISEDLVQSVGDMEDKVMIVEKAKQKKQAKEEPTGQEPTGKELTRDEPIETELSEEQPAKEETAKDGNDLFAMMGGTGEEKVHKGMQRRMLEKNLDKTMDRDKRMLMANEIGNAKGAKEVNPDETALENTVYVIVEKAEEDAALKTNGREPGEGLEIHVKEHFEIAETTGLALTEKMNDEVIDNSLAREEEYAIQRKSEETMKKNKEDPMDTGQAARVYDENWEPVRPNYIDVLNEGKDKDKGGKGKGTCSKAIRKRLPRQRSTCRETKHLSYECPKGKSKGKENTFVYWGHGKPNHPHRLYPDAKGKEKEKPWKEGHAEEEYVTDSRWQPEENNDRKQTREREAGEPSQGRNHKEEETKTEAEKKVEEEAARRTVAETEERRKERG